jgi:hypothetical protein
MLVGKIPKGKQRNKTIMDTSRKHKKIVKIIQKNKQY